MSCLGERLTALVDGELGHDERDRALAHLAGCARCRAEADALRRLKSRLRGLADSPGPAEPAFGGADDLPSRDFLARLMDLGSPAGLTDPDDLPPPPRALTDAALVGARPRDNRPSGRGDRPGGRAPRPGGGRPAAGAAVIARPRRRYLAVGAATLFLGLGTASYVAGGEQEAPAVTPAFDRFAVEHALTSGDVPVTDPLTEKAVQTSPGP